MSEAVEQAEAALRAFDDYWGDGGPVDPAYGYPYELLRALLAEVRAGVVTEEPEWEYGLTWEPDVTGFTEPQSYTGCETEQAARETGRRLASGTTQIAKVWKRPMRPAVQSLPAGPWVPVKQEGARDA